GTTRARRDVSCAICARAPAACSAPCCHPTTTPRTPIIFTSISGDGACAVERGRRAAIVVRGEDAMAKRSTFVLIHGAWGGGWNYQRVADALRAEGHEVYAPSLT